MLYPLRLFVFLSGLVLLLTPSARASHAQGGQLTYEYIGNQSTPVRPNLYKVTCRFFRDCSGIDAPLSLTLSCRVGTSATSCNSTDSRNFTATLVRGVIINGAPYCTSVGNQCSSTGRTNYQTVKYEATVTLPPAPAWTLSATESARPTLANIPGNTNLYLETTLNNQLALYGGGTQTITNTSPQYLDQNVLVPLACVRQRTTVNFSALEPDGDSLVYSLERPLDNCNVPSTYTSFTPSVIVDPTTPNCVINVPSGPIPYSATYPISSFQVTGTCPVKTATPWFQFNPRQGSFTFQPILYDATTPDRNKYVVVGKVTEYRRINGRYYQIGSVRRDMLVVIIDCGSNQIPNPPGLVAGQAGPPTDSVVVDAPILTTNLVDLHFSDPNSTDLLTVDAPLAAFSASLPYANMYTNPAAPDVPVSILANGTTAPIMRVRLRPDPSAAGTTFRIPVQVQDNACPIKGVQNFILVLRAVPNRPLATQAGRPHGVVTAFPNPFAEQVSFTLPRPAAGQPVRVYDPLGRVVAELPLPVGNTAEATLTWTPAPTLPAGVYTARATAGGPTVRLLRVRP